MVQLGADFLFFVPPPRQFCKQEDIFATLVHLRALPFICLPPVCLRPKVPGLVPPFGASGWAMEEKYLPDLMAQKDSGSALYPCGAAGQPRN